MWPADKPARHALEGRYVRLEPIAALHAEALYAASTEGAGERFRYLAESPPADVAAMCRWIETAAAASDRIYFACVDRGSGRALGRQALMSIVPEHGVIEIGSILWGPKMSRTRLATEAVFLTASYVFDVLGYRRFEWKCNNLNEASKRAALRFGFQPEGVFRQHLWVKGQNRDTAWFSMLDGEWPLLRSEYDRWLSPDNFTAATGIQRSPVLAAVRVTEA